MTHVRGRPASGCTRAPDELVRLARRAQCEGEPLEPGLRSELERTLGADLGEVRLHHGASGDRVASGCGADAVTTGADVYFKESAFRPDTDAGRRLIAHEVAHALQQTTLRAQGQGGIVLEAPLAEAAATRVATRLGRPAPAAHRRRVTRSGAGEVLVFQRHASWEHRLLGDAQPTELYQIANWPQQQRAPLVNQIVKFLSMWYANPDSVTEQMIAAYYPDIRTTRLTMSKLLVTYGELNTLPDYLANPGAIDELPREILLPILQAVRQEGYNRAQALLGPVPIPTNFAGAVAINTGWSFLDLLLETRAVNNLTWNLGVNHTDHYTALVARNACHFAPYAWYRWRHSYDVAVQRAQQAYAAGDPVEKNFFTHEAWINLGYADHFLQDSFAAGHLVNKTLIMQWFLEWAADKWYVPVADWAQVQTMTTGRQPNVAAPGLYNMENPGTVFDPQTTEEQPTLAQRIAMSGAQADGPISQQQAYMNYLAFLNSTIVQSASGALHDYFNLQSLWVGSAANPGPFQIWGDDTMLNGGVGVAIACQTAHLSQQSIAEIIATGATQITPEAIWAQFPTSVVDTPSGQRQSLQQWQYSQPVRALAFSIFPSLHYWLLRGFPRIGYVSVDAPNLILPASTLDPRRSVPAVAPSLPTH